MKKIISAILICIITVFALFITGCKTAAQKEKQAQEKVTDAQKNLTDAQNDAIVATNKAATAEEWNAFKTETSMSISNNKARIADLKARIKKSGKDLEAIYETRIDSLEVKNSLLVKRMDDYEKSKKSDWDAFKSEFNHDLNGLGQALKDFSVNNKK